MELQLGKIRTEDLARWFNIKYGTFRKNPTKYYNILEDYCDYEKVYGGIIVKEIYVPIYEKDLNLKDEKIYMEKIKHCVDEHEGLSTIAGMVNELERDG